MKMSSLFRFLTSSSCYIVASLCMPGFADEDWQFQGVITQGLSHTDANNFLGESVDDVSTEYMELSLTSSYRFTPSTSIYGQLLYRHAGSVHETDIDYLVLDHRFTQSPSRSTGVRAGRVKLPYGLYNESRDIAFTRPSVTLAQSLYSDSQRDLKLAIDGAIFYVDYFTDLGRWDFNLGYGTLNLDNISGLPGFPKKGDFDDESALIFRAMFESFDNSLRIASTIISAEVNYAFDISPFLMLPTPLKLDGKIEEQQFINSFEYVWKDWSITVEHMLKKTESNYPSPAPGVDINIKLPGEFYYLQLKKQLTSQLSLYLRRDESYENRYEKERVTSPLLPSHSLYAKDNTAGMLWSPTEDLLLGIEIHSIIGTQWLSTLDNKGETDKHWKLLLMNISYRF